VNEEALTHWGLLRQKNKIEYKIKNKIEYKINVNVTMKNKLSLKQ